MKKKIILSIIAIIMCSAMLFGIGAIRQNPKLAKEMTKAEEVIEYEYQEDTLEADGTIIEEKTEESTDTDEEEENDDACETCVCVFGKAKLTLTPDTATITACIEKFNEDINASKNENMTILNDVMDALKTEGISEEKITLDFFTAHPSYDFTAGNHPIGFYSKSCFTFEVDNLNNISNYINILTEKGITDICNINYTVSNIEEEYTNALSQALENAKAKASKLLEKDNLNICSIREEAVFCSNNLCRKYIENLSSSLMGKVEVEARVLVEFEVNE